MFMEYPAFRIYMGLIDLIITNESTYSNLVPLDNYFR
jgi:hypothetical protein